MSEWGELEGIKITGDPDIPQNKVNITNEEKTKKSLKTESTYTLYSHHLISVLADLV